MIAAREQEQQTLESLLSSNRAEFLALYGRRRVGKTHLIRSYFENREDVCFFDVAGLKDAAMAEQIINFTTRIGEVFFTGAHLATEKNWNNVFRALTAAIAQQAPERKIVLFFDEFPWMATKNSKLLQNLDYFWNQYWSKNAKIKLIICGSSASWIINKIVNNKAGLHNRITRHIQLRPFNLRETEKFLLSIGVKLNHEQILQLYMVTGGIPYYLLNVQSGISASQIIDSLAFKQNAILLNEFDNLYASLFENHQDHVSIVRLIAACRYGISQGDIFTQCDKDFKGKKGLSILKSLQDAGFITAFKPYQHKKRGIYYRVVDEYTLFYLYWIEPVKNILQAQSFEPGYWQIQQKTPSWQAWSGYAFEAICYNHIPQIKQPLALTPVDIPYTWRYIPKKHSRSQGAQIDLLFDRQDGCITLCEIKYNNKPFVINKSYAETLRHKLTAFKTQTRSKKQLFMVIIATNGMKSNRYSDELISRTVTLDDLF